VRFLCLCATYGRPTLLANALACFEAQRHPADKRFLLICDDAGQIEPHRSSRDNPTWAVMTSRQRFASLTEKYAAMMVLSGGDWGQFDAVTIWDDDDPYGPDFLSSHARALEHARWSYPRYILTLHRPPSPGYGQPAPEISHGRFWASCAVRLDLLREMGGFIQTPDANFDQQHLQKWQDLGGDPGRPDELLDDNGQLIGPQYVYGWMRSNHCSRKMNKPDWYQLHYQMQHEKVERLEPRMDDETQMIYRETWGVTLPESLPLPSARTAESERSTPLSADR
jgi:hypothetical protein